jgi:hypothetical protein
MGLSGTAPPAQAAPAPQPVQPPAPTRSYDEAKIQIRLTNGKALVQVCFLQLFRLIKLRVSPGPFQ